jgi:hypothetical protein
MAQTEQRMDNGAASAAILAAGIGSAVFGIITTISEVSASFATALNWMRPVGPLSGKAAIGVGVWLVSWIVLGPLWGKRDVRLSSVLVVSAILVAIGLIGTFPPFFYALRG